MHLFVSHPLSVSLSRSLICLTVCGDYGIIWSRCEKLINGLSARRATCVWLNCVSVWVAISKVNWEASPPSSRSPYSSSTVSASRQQLNFRTAAQNGQNTWPIGCLLQLQLPLSLLLLLLITTNSNCQRFVRVSLAVAVAASVPSPSPSPVLVGALFVANCLWRQCNKLKTNAGAAVGTNKCRASYSYS